MQDWQKPWTQPFRSFYISRSFKNKKKCLPSNNYRRETKEKQEPKLKNIANSKKDREDLRRKEEFRSFVKSAMRRKMGI
jgi:hypothetical protein